MQICVQAMGKMKQYFGERAIHIHLGDDATLKDLFEYFDVHLSRMMPDFLWNKQQQTFRGPVVVSIDPMMRVPEERLFIRAEDTVVVTPNGIENFTADAPLELEEVEQLMRQKGLLQHYPPR